MTNKIDITFSKGYYIGGDKISGDINIIIKEEIDVSSIDLFITGYEVIKFFK
jgi:hypothetical protein